MAGDAPRTASPYDVGMQEKTTIHTNDPLEHMLQRSNALHERLNTLLGDSEFDGSPRGEAALGMCLVAEEHAVALRALMALRLDFTNRPETAIPFSEVSVMQSVSPDVETRASTAASYHPLWAQATAHAYCATDVSVEAVNLIGRMRSLTDTTREELLKALLTENSVLVVSCWTSEKQPEPLAGGGKHYVFLLHPDSFQVLHAGIGTWRA